MPNQTMCWLVKMPTIHTPYGPSVSILSKCKLFNDKETIVSFRFSLFALHSHWISFADFVIVMWTMRLHILVGRFWVSAISKITTMHTFHRIYISPTWMHCTYIQTIQPIPFIPFSHHFSRVLAIFKIAFPCWFSNYDENHHTIIVRVC